MSVIRKNTNIIFVKLLKKNKLFSIIWEIFKNIEKRRIVKYILILSFITYNLIK